MSPLFHGNNCKVNIDWIPIALLWKKGSNHKKAHRYNEWFISGVDHKNHDQFFFFYVELRQRSKCKNHHNHHTPYKEAIQTLRVHLIIIKIRVINRDLEHCRLVIFHHASSVSLCYANTKWMEINIKNI
jgi:hypothetical protein